MATRAKFALLVTRANLSRRVTFFSKTAFGESGESAQHGSGIVGESGKSAQHGSANVGESGESAQHGLANVDESGESQHQHSPHQQNLHSQNLRASCHCLLKTHSFFIRSIKTLFCFTFYRFIGVVNHPQKCIFSPGENVSMILKFTFALISIDRENSLGLFCTFC